MRDLVDAGAVVDLTRRLVAVDTQTGMVTPLRYVLVCDVGRAINPLLVEGQLVGGVVHGLGGALLQELVYDADGQLLTGTLMDYALPRADSVPSIDVLILEEGGVTSNPLGVKGVGECGVVPVVPAIMSAIEDALQPFGVRINRTPMSPADILALIEKGMA